MLNLSIKLFNHKFHEPMGLIDEPMEFSDEAHFSDNQKLCVTLQKIWEGSTEFSNYKGTIY